MTYVNRIEGSSEMESSATQAMSPLMFCDRFLRLAEQADQAGYRVAAGELLQLAYDVLDAPTMSR